MLRFLLALLVTLLASLPRLAGAQVHGGLKAGLNLTTLDGTLNRRSDVRASAHGGVYLTAWLGEYVAVQPEVLYSEQGMKFGLTPTGATDNTLRMQVLNIPLLLKLYPGTKHFFVEAGPQFGLLLGATEKRVGSGGAGAVTTDIANKFKNNDYAVVAGTGVEAGRIQLGLRGIYGLSDLNNDPVEAAVRATQGLGGLHHRLLQVYAGIRLF